MENKSSKRKQILIIFAVLALLLGACSAAVTFYVRNSIPEGTLEEKKELLPSKTAVPDKNGFTAYLTDVLIANTLDSNKVKTDLSAEISIDKDSVTFEGGGKSADTAKYIVSSLAGRISEYYPSHEGDFGDGFNLFPTFAPDKSSITELEFKLGEVNPDDEGTKNETDYYYFTAKTDKLETADNISVSQRGFPLSSSAELKSAIRKVSDSLSEMLDVPSCEIELTSSVIEGKTNRLNNHLDYLTLSADYAVSLEVNFKGEYASLGKAVIGFNITAKQKYTYTWAGADITEDEIYLALNEEESLPLSVILSEKADANDYQISFESENSKAVSVDKDGNIKGLLLGEKKVKITVTFRYLGNTYTDSCDVYVTVPVKTIKVQPKKLTLSVGEKEKLTCTIKPDNATIKNISWYSENENIASVSQDGTVTAVGAGNVAVYAVSADGGFRSSCAVTVEEVK